MSYIVRRPWGTYEVLFIGYVQIKKLVVDPHQQTSLQRHKRRSETWYFPDGHIEFHPAGLWHQLRNDSDAPLVVIEVQMGDYFGEDDIERKLC